MRVLEYARLKKEEPHALRVLVCCCVIAAPAYAYTDPGSGVLLLQLALASLAGAAFYFRRGLSWLKYRVTGKKPPEVSPTSSANDDGGDNGT